MMSLTLDRPPRQASTPHAHGLGRTMMHPDLRAFWGKIWPGLIVGLCAGASISLARHFGWLE